MFVPFVIAAFFCCKAEELVEICATEGATFCEFPCRKGELSVASFCWNGNPVNAVFTLGNARLFNADRGDNDVVLLVEATVTLSELGTWFCDVIAGWFVDVCAGTAPVSVALSGNFSFKVCS